jgi:hypothetical protein
MSIRETVKRQSIILAVLALAIGHLSLALVQADEIKLAAPQPKITTVAAMRARKAPQLAAAEIARLKLATIVNAVARSTNQATIGGKTGYWYRINLPNGESGWLFGGLLLDYIPQQRLELLGQIIEARLKAENVDFADQQETYNLARSSINEAKGVSERAEFELLTLLALRNWAVTFPDDRRDQSPYREWRKTHNAEIIHNEFAGGYNLRSDLLWDLEARYHTLAIAERIAWEAAENPQPSDCEGDEVCGFFVIAGEVKYLTLHPHGSHVAKAITNLAEALTDEVISAANAKGGDKYMVEQRLALRKTLASLRLAVAKISVPEKTALIKKLEKVNSWLISPAVPSMHLERTAVWFGR